MADFCRLMQLRPGMRVLDIGGTPDIWQCVDVPLHVTLLNLEHCSNRDVVSGLHVFSYVVGNACNPETITDHYDLVFSNSVIEHVGDETQQHRLATNILRSGASYWVQTPAKWFPIEAHTGMPLWWFYPPKLRQWFVNSWRQKLPSWTEYVEGTRLVELGALKRMFPDAHVHVEKSLGIVKSYTAYGFCNPLRDAGQNSEQSVHPLG
jgi:hypothetical protein